MPWTCRTVAAASAGRGGSGPALAAGFRALCAAAGAEALPDLLAQQLEGLKQQGTYKAERVIQTPQGPLVGKPAALHSRDLCGLWQLPRTHTEHAHTPTPRA